MVARVDTCSAVQKRNACVGKAVLFLSCEVRNRGSGWFLAGFDSWGVGC
jgi:hypothetical protein